MVYARQFAVLLVIFLIPACGDGGSTSTSTGSGGRGESSSSSGQGGMGGSGGEGGMGGSGGAGGSGGGAPSHGPAATSLVNAGETSKSTNFKLVWTLGQSSQNQSKMTSPGYRLQGGLSGANGSLP